MIDKAELKKQIQIVYNQMIKHSQTCTECDPWTKCNYYNNLHKQHSMLIEMANPMYRYQKSR